jgi:myo-inositol-1(or 4)-monophosphatase
MAANWESILAQAAAAVEEAANYIRSQYGRVDLHQADVKAAKSFVSYVDQEAERLLVQRLQVILPESGFITEEETVPNLEKQYTWVIDPLDGTTNFLYRIPFVAVSVALRREGITQLGVVADVLNGHVYEALKGSGAKKNGHAICVSERTLLSQAVIATGFPYEYTQDTESQIEALKRLVRATNGIRRFGSAALDLCMLAEGVFDGYYEYALNEWDTAAGMLILREAGGVCSDRGGDRLYEAGREIVASNGLIHDEFLSFLA